MNHKLTFINPQIHFGNNVTIRRGVDWYERASIGDSVEIYRSGMDTLLAGGVITSVVIKPFRDVTIQELFDEHDVECRTPQGLTVAMLRAYPEFTLNDIVTVICFEIK